eukprot:CAMPEP_0181292398 /NCGR_PEP_ID=MMETSP1101-20121128/2484_1 /TAXON_ID=46948 /ORGANISM="Rhodomonas abbreviata, Strain Caron Lab Isolate" /LENGTH=51 /DNA_ID=CAMNT_0023396863 /DNA_START=109 /DNA_END=264 /DNA_ORIENTATION=+
MQQFVQLFEKHLPKYGTYDYSAMADKIGLGTNVVFGVHDRPSNEGAQANIH